MSKMEIQELFTTSQGTEGSLLIAKKIYDTIWDAVEKRLIGRQFAAIVLGPDSIPGSSVDINLADPDSMRVRTIAEGAGIPIDNVTFSSINLKPLKYGVRPVITKEMIEDSQFDLMAYNLATAGREMAENEDALIVTDALDNAGNTVAGGAAVTIANITRAMQYLEDSDYRPNVLLVGPEVANDLRNIDTFAEADKFGTREMQERGFIGRIYGMDVFMMSTAAITSTSSYVIDREQAFVIAEKRPVSIEEYDDKTHDLSGVVITQRIKIRHLRASAIAKVTST